MQIYFQLLGKADPDFWAALNTRNIGKDNENLKYIYRQRMEKNIIPIFELSSGVLFIEY